MARTDYYAITTPTLQATSQAIRTVNGTVGTIAPADWGNLIRAMHSSADYDNVMAQLVEETVSGSTVTFADGANNIPCKNLEVNIDAWQEGTGNPSPNNKRPIHGRSSSTVTREGDDETDTYTIQLGDEIFGGKVNFTTGVMEVDHKTYLLFEISEYRNWYGRKTVQFSISDIISTSQSVFNVFGEVLRPTNLTTVDFGIFHQNKNIVIILPDDYTVSDYNSYVAGTKLLYPLATPFTVQLTPQQISTLLGNNTFFADTGDISMTYRANGALYVAQH